jgi:hypothetical protein
LKLKTQFASSVPLLFILLTFRRFFILMSTLSLYLCFSGGSFEVPEVLFLARPLSHPVSFRYLPSFSIFRRSSGQLGLLHKARPDGRSAAARQTVSYLGGIYLPRIEPSGRPDLRQEVTDFTFLDQG